MNREDLFEEKDEIENDIKNLQEKIENTTDETETVTLSKMLAILQKDLKAINSRLEPVIKCVTEGNYYDLTEKLLDETFLNYFLYAILSHPDMQKALRVVDKDRLRISEYEGLIKKYIGIFLVEDYLDGTFQDEFIKNHKSWVLANNPEHVFSFENCVAQRGVANAEKIALGLDKLFTLNLIPLIEKYELYKSCAIRAEKERIEKARKKKIEKEDEIAIPPSTFDLFDENYEEVTSN